MQRESCRNAVLYYIFKGCNLMQSEMLAPWADGKDLWKGKYQKCSAITLVLSTENVFCKSGIKTHFLYIFGTKSWISANSVQSL